MLHRVIEEVGGAHIEGVIEEVGVVKVTFDDRRSSSSSPLVNQVGSWIQQP